MAHGCITTVESMIADPDVPNPLGSVQTAVRGRTGRRHFRTALVWLAAAVLAAHLGGLVAPWLSGAAGWSWFAPVAVVALVMLGLGVRQLIITVREQPSWLGAAIAAGVVTGILVLTSPAAGLIAFILGIGHLAGPVAAVAVGAVLLAVRRRPGRAAGSRPWTAAIAGLVAVVAVLAIALIDTFVLLPMQLVPDQPLDTIYAQLEAAGEASGRWMPIVWAALWAVGAAVLAIGLIRAHTSRRVASGALLATASVALEGLPVAQIGLGMNLADTFVTSGGMSWALPVIMLFAALLAAGSATLLASAPSRDARTASVAHPL